MQELRSRLDGACGVTFGEVSDALDETAKGLARSILRRLIGMSEKQLSSVAHGAVKTVPVRPDGKPREPTKICGIDYDDLRDQTFFESDVARRLTAILFVPIIKHRTDDPATWYIIDPFVWVPGEETWETFARDYEEARSLVRDGRAEDLSSSAKSGQGTYLTPKTSGRSGFQNLYLAGDGRPIRAKDRAFFMRDGLTATLLADHVELDGHCSLIEQHTRRALEEVPEPSPNMQLLLDLLVS